MLKSCLAGAQKPMNGVPVRTSGLRAALQARQNLRMPFSHSARLAQKGFTLVELMLVVVMLAVIAYPSYKEVIRKSRRAEAFTAIAAVQQAQERFRANKPTYGNLAVPADANTLPNDVPKQSSNGRYVLTVTDNSDIGYVVLATATGDQAQDTACAVLGARLRVGALYYGSGATAVDWSMSEPDTGRCWKK
jgi:type IV pilus assembly protein PilE